MKQHLSLEDLIVIGPENILTLSNQKEIDTTWLEWSTPEHVIKALDVYQEKGWKHSSLVRTAELCNLGNVISMLDHRGTLEMRKAHHDGDLKWRVWYRVKPSYGIFERTVYAPELLDALWIILHDYLNTRDRP